MIPVERSDPPSRTVPPASHWEARYNHGMSSAAKAILESALKLDPEERKALAHELLDSVDASADTELSPAWEAEIEQRLRKIESGEATFVSAEEVFERSEAILRGER
jgi:putative addiction module component (TIGR02574 family)